MHIVLNCQNVWEKRTHQDSAYILVDVVEHKSIKAGIWSLSDVWVLSTHNVPINTECAVLQARCDSGSDTVTEFYKTAASLTVYLSDVNLFFMSCRTHYVPLDGSARQ